MNKQIHTIDLYGVEIEVHGYYYPSILGDYYNPPSEELFEVEAVCVGGIDITELVDNHIETIEEQILKTVYA